MKLRNTLLAFFALFAFASCSLFEEDEDEIVTMIEMFVASETVEMTVHKFLSNNETYLEEFLSVQIQGSYEWTEFGILEIDGFKFDDGWEYSLRVRRIELLNPPLDGSSIIYELDRVISKRHVNRSIAKVERYWIGKNMAVAQGLNLFERDARDIERNILSYMSPVGTYKSYKFIYDDQLLTKGRIVVYTDDRKEVGTFNRVAVQGGDKFYIEIAQYRYEYLLMPRITRSNILEPWAFIEDVTSEYIARFPYLELAVAQQLISYWE